MDYRLYVSLVLGFVVAAGGADAADLSKGKPDRWGRDVMELEQIWNSTNRVEYFQRASYLFRSNFGNCWTNAEMCISRLDLASSVIVRAQDLSAIPLEVRYDVYINVDRVVARLCDANVDELKERALWPELRARLARLMMLQRATWINLNDPTLDGKKLVQMSVVQTWRLGNPFNGGYSCTNSQGTLCWKETNSPSDSQVSEEQERFDSAARERERMNARIQFQYCIKRAIEDVGPSIDSFMVSTFSTEPADLRMLNELLAMGRYEPSERAKIVKAVAAKFGDVGEDMRIQLP